VNIQTTVVCIFTNLLEYRPTQQTKLRVEPVELVVSSASSSSCRARRARRVEPCCSTSSTQPKCMGSTRL